MDKLRQGLNWIDSLWADYVMEMDRKRQEEAVYQPLLTTMRAAVRNLCSGAWWRSKLHGLGNLLNLSRWNGLGGWLLHVGLPLALMLALAGWLGRGLWRRARRLWRRLGDRAASPARRARPRVEFYRRFEALLARQGLVRAAGQTPREFARAAAERIVAAHRPAGPGRPSRARVVDAFYRVRFGGLPLDNPQREAVEHGLAELEHVALSRRGIAALGPLHENRSGRLSRIGQEHAVRVADGRDARPGAVARRPERHGRRPRAPRRGALQDLPAEEGDAGGAGDRSTRRA